ncbi:MAG TPA: hypothetical protein VNO51_15085 [Ilumatobacteraceae bacterium]|nr:hypothetical protein [Ilumatobacteraceae bacterium]
MARFDVHVVVDWSAAGAAKRGRDSIWCASAGVDRAPNPINLATRLEAATYLDDLIRSQPDRRILIGFDFPFGYPTGTAAALGLAGEPWRATWDLLTELIRDDDRNANNRFDVAAQLNGRLGATVGPFWGCPVARQQLQLRCTKPPFVGPLAEYRRCERVLRGGGLRPFSVWQLSYPGSVGGQALVGIPVLASLLRAHPHRVEVWPFTTGLRPRPAAANAGAVVLAELWPSWFAVTHPPDVVKDASQVTQTVAVLAAADRTGELDTWFDPPMPVGDRGLVEREEGWILGPAIGGVAGG